MFLQALLAHHNSASWGGRLLGGPAAKVDDMADVHARLYVAAERLVGDSVGEVLRPIDPDCKQLAHCRIAAGIPVSWFDSVNTHHALRHMGRTRDRLATPEGPCEGPSVRPGTGGHYLR